MTQKALPASIGGVVSGLKRRVHRLERDLSKVRSDAALRNATATATGAHLITDPSWPPWVKVFPAAPDNASAQVSSYVFHPTGANLRSVLIYAGGLEDDAERTPVGATISLLQAGPGRFDEVTPRPVQTLDGNDLADIPYDTWWQAARVECARTWVPPMGHLGMVLSAPAHMIQIMLVMWEFDTAPRGRTS